MKSPTAGKAENRANDRAARLLDPAAPWPRGRFLASGTLFTENSM
jgi:hypothetical protein